MERYGYLFPSPDHQKAIAVVEAKLLGQAADKMHEAVQPPTMSDRSFELLTDADLRRLSELARADLQDLFARRHDTGEL
jgi:hypothetical protein